jgi:hypothetical protein
MTTGLYYFNGDIAEIQLYNRALNSLELTADNEILAATYGVQGAAGEVIVWGSNSGGQTNVPLTLTNVVSLASGSDFNLSLTGNGTITAWGDNDLGQLSPVAGLTNVSAISAGNVFTLAIGNQTPLASNATYSGFVNHDLIFTLSAADPDGNPLSFQVLTPPSAGTLYQYSGGARGSQINSTNTLVSDPAGQVVFAPVAGAVGTPYADIDFVAQDPFYTSSAAQVNINIGLPAAPQFYNVPASLTAAGFVLAIAGSSNAIYSLWVSSNLLNWIKIGTATEASPGRYQFVDATMTNWPQRFYRASAP